MVHKKNKFSIFPIKRRELITIQDVKQTAQTAGWHITIFNLQDLWKITRGVGIKIAILDSGVDLNHDDLKCNLLSGINFININNPPQDDNGHGTAMAGIIAANDTNYGIVGVAPECKIIPIKVLDAKGNGSFDNVAKGLRWAVDNGADIISLSAGCPMPLQQVRKALQYAHSKNIPVFAAAGNAGFTKEMYYPSAYPESIGIGSIDENFDLSHFSCIGKNLDFLAPGSDIVCTVPPNWYATMSGTSLSTPWVAGVAALLLSYTRINKTNFILKTVDDFKRILQEYTIPLNDVDFKNKKFFILDPRKIESNIKLHQID
jgi:subtilisin family serine protease